MITINLTTTCQRLNLCRITIISLLLQSHLPDKINLWVSKEPYLRDKGIGSNDVIELLIESLPEAHRHLVAVRWTTNIGPYRKLIPMLREASSDDVIVTADDDIFYGRNWLSGLLTAFEAAGGKAVAARVKSKKVNFLGKETSYLFWRLINQCAVISDDYIVTFGGGAVLTRSMFREQDIADDSFLTIAATTDDLWYSKLLQLNKNKVVVAPGLLKELNFIQHNDGLTNYNFSSGRSLIRKIRIRLWDKTIGFLGMPVCGNDVAYADIERHFDVLKQQNSSRGSANVI